MVFGRIQLAAEFLQTFALVEVVEVRSRSYSESRKDKPRLGLLRGLLPLAAARFVIVAAYENGFFRELVAYSSRHEKEIVCRKSDIHRAFTGKMNAGSGGVALANGERFFRFALDNEMPAVDSAAGEKAFLAVFENTLQALQLARHIPYRHKQRSVLRLTDFAKWRNAFAP